MLVAALLALLLAACGGADVGPCVITPREPIITLISSDASLLRVSHLRIDGRRVQPAVLVGGVAEGVATAADRGGITCRVPCGFGVRPGDWEFRVTLPGQRHLEVREQAGYAESEGGCPGYVDGGVVIDVDQR